MKLVYRQFAGLLLLLTIALGMVRCNEDGSGSGAGEDIEIRDSLPQGTYNVEVSNITVTSAERALNVKWTAPDVNDLSYYIVEWQGTEKDNTIYGAPVKTNSFKISGLYNESYRVKVYCVSKKFWKSNGVELPQVEDPISDETAPEQIKSLNVASFATSATLTWVNPDDEDFDHLDVVVTKAEDGDTILSKRLLVIDNTVTIFGLDEKSTYNYAFQGFDYIGNSTDVLSGDFKTLTEKKLDNKAEWTLEGFSSEESDGKAETCIDGKEDTFWHSAWRSAKPLPQYVVIDLKKAVLLSAMETFKRNGNPNGPTSVKLDGKLAWTDDWTDLGTSPVNKDSFAGQKVNAQKLMEVRYVKVSVMAASNGFAMIREIDAWSLVSE